jgi:hypothetical protein
LLLHGGELLIEQQLLCQPIQYVDRVEGASLPRAACRYLSRRNRNLGVLLKFTQGIGLLAESTALRSAVEFNARRSHWAQHSSLTHRREEPFRQ